MSSHKTIEVQCPACNAPGSYEMWDSVNRELDPEAATALGRGTLIQFHCPECKVSSPVSHPLLLHALKQREMVQFGVEGDQPTVPEAARKLLTSQGIRLWTAPTQNHLMECARLYDAGFDIFAMRVFAERIRHEIESAKGLVVDDAHFDHLEAVAGIATVAFAVLVKSQDEPLWITAPRNEIIANEVLMAPFRDRCAPGGIWTAWDRVTATAGLEMVAAASGARK